MYCSIEDFKGEVFWGVSIDYESNSVMFYTDAGGHGFQMRHDQDCCERVVLKDVSGDLDDLEGAQILLAECQTSGKPYADESHTWTFYRLGTIKGYVTISFYGSSNGYYSESVSIVKV